MNWITELLHSNSVAHAILVLSLVMALGLALGSLRIGGFGLGTVGVLFVGLFFGHWGVTVDHQILEFAREMGLILFVYTIGMQVGPGFFAAFRKQGILLNTLAFAIVLLGFLTALGIHVFAHVPIPAVVGLFSGGTTNTPSLAAASQALMELLPGARHADLLKLPSMAYAVAYPFGIFGIIITMLIIRFMFRVQPTREAEAFLAEQRADSKPILTRNIRVTNPNFEGLMIKEIPLLEELQVVISRIAHKSRGKLKMALAKPSTRLALNDVLYVVGTEDKLQQFQLVAGEEATGIDVKAIPGPVVGKRLVVTNKSVVGKSIRELKLRSRFDVQVTRITRGDVQLVPSSHLNLQYGDILQVVGEADDIEPCAEYVGNAIKELNYPQVVPIFVGVALGVLLGSWPFFIPGVPAGLKLGLAGGPLIVALLLSKLGNIGRLNWYLHPSANYILRELGIVVFLACVGIHGGDRFMETLLAGDGIKWMLLSPLITLVPLLIVGITARWIFKLNYTVICGLLAGSMTDPPALNFATAMTESDAPSVSYATVYPLVMILRILAAQILVVLFMAV